LGLFAKLRYPVRLDTVRAESGPLYEVMSRDIERLNGFYSIFPDGVAAGLLSDLQQLIGSDVAGEFRLAFYDPLDTEKVYLEKRYHLSPGSRRTTGGTAIEKYSLPKPYEFDVFVYFSDRFAALDPEAQARRLQQFTFNWFSFPGGGNGHHPDVAAQRLTPGRAEDARPIGDRRAAHHVSDHVPDADASQGRAPSDDRFGVRDGIRDDDREGVRGDVRGDEATEGDDSGPLTPAARNVGLRPVRSAASIEEAALAKQLTSEHSLFIAAYTDSRKLITRFMGVSALLGLTPLQWTLSEGFREIADAHAGKYAINDDYLLNAKLTPLEALGAIRNDCRSRTLYLLEDFHYYLKRENLSGQEFVELISLMKSMPEVLKRQESVMVVLAPTLDLPPEVAPIFGFIRDEVAGRRLHFLERFGRDLTQQVEEGRIKPIVGRDREIYACLKVLSQMEANNPILVGKAGVGKTAVVEGLAHLIVKQSVPAMFKDRRIIALNLNAMVSGTKYRGEFETRVEGLVEEVRSNVGRIIVFIDEIHTLLGMGSTEGSTGAENILKPSLARGEFPCIGATTSEEYKRFIEPDKALARRFQTVMVSEPDVPQSIEILRGIRSVYEKHYGLRISDPALVACVETAARFLPTQSFPGKAIRLLDGVCASASLAGKQSVDEESVADECNRP
jgi:hypothetical protein